MTTFSFWAYVTSEGGYLLLLCLSFILAEWLHNTHCIYPPKFHTVLGGIYFGLAIGFGIIFASVPIYCLITGTGWYTAYVV